MLYTRRPRITRQAKRPLLAETLLLVVFILAITLFGIYGQAPPAPVAKDAPATDFSSQRALQHVNQIAVEPHPVGSTANARVRDYLMEQLEQLGLEPQIQRTSATHQGYRTSATVENVMARLPGTNSSKAVLVVGHYDSVPTAPGAADNSAAVSTMLETIRALQVGDALRNDVIFLFTDGEEVGLLGAIAFVDEHPWANQVGVVLNLEARGTSGASIMFETSEGNGWLIKQLASSVPRIVANSLSYEIYRQMPNNTDFSIFKDAGYPGMNFAFVEEPHHYHTMLDNIENLSEASLQHHGVYTLSLVRSLGEMDLTEEPISGNRVYFNLGNSLLIHYPTDWILPMSIGLIVLFAVSLFYGFADNRLRLSGLVVGLLVFVASIAGIGLLMHYISQWVMLEDSIYRQLPPASLLWYLGLFSALTVTVVSALYSLALSRFSWQGLTLGVELGWLIITVAVSQLIPGASYFFFWPLLFSLVATTVAFASERFNSVLRSGLLGFAMLPLLLLWPGMLRLIYLAMGLSMTGATMALIAMLFSLLVPQLAVFRTVSRSGLSLVMLLLALLSLAGLFFADSAPAMNSLFYHLDSDTKKATWLSLDEKPDEWTTQVFDSDFEKIDLSEVMPGQHFSAISKSAQPLPLEPVNVRVMASVLMDDARRLYVNISSPRQAPTIHLWGAPREIPGRIDIDGKSVHWHEDNLKLVFRAVPKQGVDVVFEVDRDQPLKLRAMDQTAGLPDFFEQVNQPKRPAHLTPGPIGVTDSVLTSKAFVF